MKRTIQLITIGLLAAGVANAATIAWTTDTITDINDVRTEGTTVLAVNNSGSGAPTTVTVAGIDFTEDNAQLPNNFNGDIYTPTTGDANYDIFLGDIDYNGSATASNTTINLTVEDEQEYLLQVWYADSNPQGRQMTLAGTGANVLATGNEYAVGLFTADSTTQVLDITMSGGASNGVRLTGYQLRAIPEPATLGLLAAFGGGIMFIRRRFMI